MAGVITKSASCGVITKGVITRFMATNAEKCRAYYERLKLDPIRHATWLKKQAEKMRKKRAEQKSQGDNRVITEAATEPVITPPVTTPSSVLTRGDIRRLAQEIAAIMEFDGGMSRANAESAALRELVKDYGDKVLSIADLFKPVD